MASSRRRLFGRIGVALAVATVGAAGIVAAQPTAPPSQGVQAPAPPPSPPAPAPEGPPPANVAPPAPQPVPAISPEEVAPAPTNSTAAKTPEAPQKRARYDVAVLQALDKVTAETLRFEAAVGKPVRYKTLIFTVRACEKSTPTEPVEDSMAYVEVLSQPRAEPGRPTLPPKQAFKGWMFAASPGLNPLEHPVYDAWLITCRTASPVSPPAP